MSVAEEQNKDMSEEVKDQAVPASENTEVSPDKEEKKDQEATPEAPAAEKEQPKEEAAIEEAPKEEAVTAPEEAPATEEAPKEEENKGPSNQPKATESANPTECAATGKPLKKKLWYYRDGQYYMNKKAYLRKRKEQANAGEGK
ncbi:MAG: hypothetical protein PHH49_07615 [Candidatus Omnitrophica bacterium]|nr:hypothetical protein [Candidatus Omnitrophota bacterium]